MLRESRGGDSGGRVGDQAHVLLDRYRAVLFDLDGTLIDTMPLHCRAYVAVFAERGLTLAEADYYAAVGAPAREAIPRFLKAAGQADWSEDEVREIHEAKKRRFDAAFDRAAIVTLEAATLLERVRGRLRTGLVTSGNVQGLKTLLDGMGWWDRFEAVVSGDDVTRGKPHPEPYLRAAALLGVAPGDCLVLEDTADGLASARGAGMDAIDVTRPWSAA